METNKEMGCVASLRLVSSEQCPDRKTVYLYDYVVKEGVDPQSPEAYWTAVNLIRDRLYQSHA
jgi:hypothetical protein